MKVRTVRGMPLNAQPWLQIDSILAQKGPNVGQINMPCVYMDEYGTDTPAKTEGVRKYVKGQLVPIGPGGGFFTLANEILREGTRQQAVFINQLQMTIFAPCPNLRAWPSGWASDLRK